MAIEQFLRALEQADGTEAIQAAVVALRDNLAVDHLVYHWVSTDGEQYGFGTYDPAWVQHYVDRDYLRIDPVVLGCFQRFHPVDWRRVDWTGKAARAFRADAIAHGIGPQGLSIPIRGPNGQFALFTVSDSRDDAAWSDFTMQWQRDLILIGHYLNSKALEVAGARRPEPVKALSPRELDVLTYLAMGYSRGQIAEMLDISEHTLRAYVEGARLKLGALNTVHAVARAVAEGLILVGGAVRGAVGDWPGRQPLGSRAETRGGLRAH